MVYTLISPRGLRPHTVLGITPQSLLLLFSRRTFSVVLQGAVKEQRLFLHNLAPQSNTLLDTGRQLILLSGKME